MLDLVAVRLVLALVTYLVVAALGLKLLALAGFDPRRRAENPLSPATLGLAAAINTAVLAATLGLQRWVDRRPVFTGFQLDANVVRWSAASVALTFVLAKAFSRKRRPQDDEPLPTATIAAGLTTLFAGALMEEVLFRGYFVENLRESGPTVALAVSTVAFTAIHLPTSKVTPARTTSWLLGGLSLGVLYWETRSLWLCTAAHFVHNLANVLFIEPVPGLRSRAGTPLGDGARTTYYAALAAALVALGFAAHA